MSVMVRYTVKPDEQEANVERVRAVFAELAEVRPPAFQYACFTLEDGVSFVHVASGDFDLGSLASFRAFLDGHEARREGPTERSPLREVGSYASS